MKVTVMFVMIGVLTASLLSLGKSDKKDIKVVKKMIKDTTEVVAVDSSKLDKELLVNYILKQNIQHPEVAYAIVRQESNMCSNLFKSNNNLFGMKHPGVRPTKSLGRKSGFAHFEKWQHSVEDYKLYLEFVGGHMMSKQQYLLHLDRNYAHRGYSSYISKFFEEFYELKNN
jgi:hypothetical protein